MEINRKAIIDASIINLKNIINEYATEEQAKNAIVEYNSETGLVDITGLPQNVLDLIRQELDRRQSES